MTTGTRSLLFGVHHLLWHPYTVLRAWIELYGKPNWKELICILVHDIGYKGVDDLNSQADHRHPELGARLVRFLFKDNYYYMLCLYHSRHYARDAGAEPSKLCYADKLSIKYDPKWFYLFRARLTGEISYYRKESACMFSINKSDSEWFDWIKKWLIAIGKTKNVHYAKYTH